jgi:hypothetical protein
MKKLLVILILTLVICCFTSCGVLDGEYEVIAVASYTIVTGANESGPIEETRCAFIYTDNGKPQLRSNYCHDTSYPGHENYVIIGDTNKYVVVQRYRSEKEYLYLTKETYDSIFSEAETNG